jgi:hypothetical protein
MFYNPFVTKLRRTVVCVAQKQAPQILEHVLFPGSLSHFCLAGELTQYVSQYLMSLLHLYLSD